jgi:hypothetical protein
MCADNFTVSSFLEAIEDQTTSASESLQETAQIDNKPENERDREGQKDDKRVTKDNDFMEEGV